VVPLVPPPAGQPPVAAQPPATPPATPLAEDARGQLAAAFAQRDVAGVSSGYRSGAPNVVGNQFANNCLHFSFTPPIRSGFVALNDGQTGINFPRSDSRGVLDPLSFSVFEFQTDFGNIGSGGETGALIRSRNSLATDNELFRNRSPIPMDTPDAAALVDFLRQQLLAIYGPGDLVFAGGTIDSTNSEPGPDISPSEPFLLQGAYDYFASQFLMEFCIVPPGSLVGRYKVAENNSPIPRDRAFFSYNHFNGTPLGRDVNRFTPGIEKTFFDGMGSVEARLPFASTLNGDLIVDNVFSNGNDTRLGNLQLAVKMLLTYSDTWILSGGLGVAVPTADDINARLPDGTPLLRIENEAFHLQPFIGYLYAPDNYFYFQGFSQIDIDLNGDPVFANPIAPFGTTLRPIGRLRDRTLWSNDIAIGYWLFRDSCSFISGVAPQLEVHYDQTLDEYSTLRSGGVVLSGGGSYTSVALTGALNVELRQDATLTLGMALPVTDDFNRGFDWEFMLQFNYRFGASVAGNTPGFAGGGR
jgi:hypothetical protein